MSGDFASMSARLQRSLSQAKSQLLVLESRISVGAWPDKDKAWAMNFITAQAEALRDIRGAEKRRYRPPLPGAP